LAEAVIKAKENGFKTAILLNRSKGKIECKQADAVVDDLKQAIEAITTHFI